MNEIWVRGGKSGLVISNIIIDIVGKTQGYCGIFMPWVFYGGLEIVAAYFTFFICFNIHIRPFSQET